MGLLEKNPEENMPRILSNLDNLKSDPNEAVAYLRAKAINFLVTECARVFVDNNEAILKGSFSGALVDHCQSVQEPLKQIEAISIERIYNHSSVVKIELAGFKIMSGLIEDLVEASLAVEKEKRHKKLLNLMPVQYRYQEDDSDYEKIMCILDYVSGMTDNYALELYRNLRGISVPEI